MSRQIYGIVHEDGNIITGKGFKARKLETGTYLVEFDQPFTDFPVPVTNIQGHPWRTFNMSTAVIGISSRDFVVLSSTPDQPEDCGFSFVVFGD